MGVNYYTTASKGAIDIIVAAAATSPDHQDEGNVSNDDVCVHMEHTHLLGG